MSVPRLATAVALTLLAVLSRSAAPAAADVIPVRIEGATTTLFEGPVRTGPGYVQATSDSVRHRCDGTNNFANASAGASATKAAVDGLRTAGLDFGASWFPGFDDYFIERLGPDRQSEERYDYWGVLVDDVFTDVGGCQAKVADGQRVLWAYDAFHQRGFLTLRAAGDAGAAPKPTVQVEIGAPLTVAVTRRYGKRDEANLIGTDALVAEVDTAANGVQSIRTAGAVPTAADGTAEVRFSTPGWHRIKATSAATAGPIRSNRLDVCVVAAGQDGCGALPTGAEPREAPPLPAIPEGPGNTATPAPGKGSTGSGAGSVQGAPTIQFPAFSTAGDRRGLVGVSWKILKPGIGVRSWAFSYRTAGAKRGAFKVAKRGTTGRTALLRLPVGRVWDVRATFTDTAGRSVSGEVGNVLVPIDERTRAVRSSGPWKPRTDRRAWRGGVLRGSPGAMASVRLPAGRPVVVLRGSRKSVDIELRAAGGKAELYRVSGTSTTRSREVIGTRRRQAGRVTVRIVRGTADVDGVGVRP